MGLGEANERFVVTASYIKPILNVPFLLWRSSKKLKAR